MAVELYQMHFWHLWKWLCDICFLLLMWITVIDFFFFLLFLIKSKPAILENFVFWTERQKSRILILYQYTFIFIFSFYLFSSLALHPTWGSSSQPKIKSGTLYWLNQSYIPGGELYLIMMCFPFVYISRFNLSVFSLGFLTLCS